MAELGDDKWLSDITLDRVLAMFLDQGVAEILYKVLPQNANSKNQVYLGGKDPSQFAKIPTGEMSAHLSVSEKSGKKEAIFRAYLDFHWITEEGHLSQAPNANMIFYPQYPEVRFSGFLKGSKHPPSTLWVKEKRGTEPGRILLLGVGNGTKTIGMTLPPEAPATKEILANSDKHPSYEVFGILPLPGQDLKDGFLSLMESLCQIHNRNWVRSHRLNKEGIIVPCEATNCNGNTLEALLGIKSNGISKPDYMGWEVKARQVKDINRPSNSTVTLFTPEPDLGEYVDKGVIEFILNNGYPDTKNRPDRRNVGGGYYVNRKPHHMTKLHLRLVGFDPETGFVSPTGAVILMDRNEDVAAGWSFTKLMDHWKAKHAQTAFVPCEMAPDPLRYRYSRNILLGEGAEFKLLLHAFQQGKVYYDPGIKLEGIESQQYTWKKRSQFRVRSKYLADLYKESRTVDACEIVNASRPRAGCVS